MQFMLNFTEPKQSLNSYSQAPGSEYKAAIPAHSWWGDTQKCGRPSLSGRLGPRVAFLLGMLPSLLGVHVLIHKLREWQASNEDTYKAQSKPRGKNWRAGCIIVIFICPFSYPKLMPTSVLWAILGSLAPYWSFPLPSISVQEPMSCSPARSPLPGWATLLHFHSSLSSALFHCMPLWAPPSHPKARR